MSLVSLEDKLPERVMTIGKQGLARMVLKKAYATGNLDAYGNRPTSASQKGSAREDRHGDLRMLCQTMPERAPNFAGTLIRGAIKQISMVSRRPLRKTTPLNSQLWPCAEA